MKWELKEPTLGDIIRVKTGSIYHYGIYVSDEEVIQFGLNPISRQGVQEKDVAICTSDINDFLVGGFLEIGVLEKKDKKRFPKKKTVELARGRLGEKGYNILYNNCEHFANECYFGEKYSSQTDGIRALFRNKPTVDVYVAEIPKTDDFKKIYPKTRRKEIKGTSNPLVKREKYFVWKLLEYALGQSFDKKIKDVKLEKGSSGKWVCDVCEFSLSHSKNLVCVALSKTPVGVDVERIEPTKADISKTILSDEEYLQYSALQGDEKTKFIIDAWTRKESLFKCKNEKSLTREAFQQLTEPVFQTSICLGEESYSLSVATKEINAVKIHENIDLLQV